MSRLQPPVDTYSNVNVPSGLNIFLDPVRPGEKNLTVGFLAKRWGDIMGWTFEAGLSFIEDMIHAREVGWVWPDGTVFEGNVLDHENLVCPDENAAARANGTAAVEGTRHGANLQH